MNRREWIGTMLKGTAGAAIVPFVPGTAIAQPTESECSQFADPASPLFGYFTRGLTDSARGVHTCPLMNDSDNDEGFTLRVKAWCAGWLRGETGSRRRNVATLPADSTP